jgi:hypothetical protein
MASNAPRRFDLGWDGNSVKGDSYASTGWARPQHFRMSAERNRAGTVLSIPAVAMIQVVHNRKISRFWSRVDTRPHRLEVLPSGVKFSILVSKRKKREEQIENGFREPWSGRFGASYAY